MRGRQRLLRVIAANIQTAVFAAVNVSVPSFHPAPPVVLLFFILFVLLLPGCSLHLRPFADFEVTGEVVFGEKRFVAFRADKVSAALVRVHVLLQVVGLEEVFVALWTLYPAFTEKQEEEYGWNQKRMAFKESDDSSKTVG